MPLIVRGRQAKRRKSKSRAHGKKQPVVTLRDFRRKHAGRYRFTWTGPQKGRTAVTFDVVVLHKSHRHKKSGRRRAKKLLFAAWRVRGTPVEIRELYRKRFAIESSYRQLGQARTRTSTRSPVERLMFVLITLVLRNLWVWRHWMYFAEGRRDDPVMRLERLRLRRMLNWIAHMITQSLHDGTAYST